MEVVSPRAKGKAGCSCQLLCPAPKTLMLACLLATPRHRLFGCNKSGHGSGAIGRLTRGVLTEGYYQWAAICALTPLLNPGLYDPGWELQPQPLREGANQQR